MNSATWSVNPVSFPFIGFSALLVWGAIPIDGLTRPETILTGLLMLPLAEYGGSVKIEGRGGPMVLAVGAIWMLSIVTIVYGLGSLVGA